MTAFAGYASPLPAAVPAAAAPAASFQGALSAFVPAHPGAAAAAAAAAADLHPLPCLAWECLPDPSRAATQGMACCHCYLHGALQVCERHLPSATLSWDGCSVSWWRQQCNHQHWWSQVREVGVSATQGVAERAGAIGARGVVLAFAACIIKTAGPDAGDASAVAGGARLGVVVGVKPAMLASACPRLLLLAPTCPIEVPPPCDATLAPACPLVTPPLAGALAAAALLLLCGTDRALAPGLLLPPPAVAVPARKGTFLPTCCCMRSAGAEALTAFVRLLLPAGGVERVPQPVSARNGCVQKDQLLKQKGFCDAALGVQEAPETQHLQVGPSAQSMDKTSK
eukprot:1160396-Pelagomonas_calceolata.AAC.12